MEHRLIQGGEQFLPFARSCVTKLKKLGLPYADQSYEVDGCSIKVRIEPGHEYIRIEGGKIAMESGAILIGSYSLYSLYTMDSSKLYRPTYTAAQYASDKRQRPKKPVPKDSAVYCRPKPPDVIDDTPYVYNGPFDLPDGGGPLSAKLLELHAKKRALMGTLAAKFSGKTRLFVQAILGSNPLRLTSRFENGKVWTYLDECYRLETDTAVFVDSHGEYWMIRVGYTDAMRMRFSPSGEAIKSRLKVGKDIGEGERVREEAYMFSSLAEIKPNLHVGSEIMPEAYQGEIIDFTEPSPGEFAIAHGWHFSRSSGQGIKVKHKVSDAEVPYGSMYKLEAQIYRLTFSSSADRGQAPSIAVTSSGYYIWTKDRGEFALFGVANGLNYPWFPMGVGVIETCSAPIYAFYAADDSERVVWFSRGVSGAVPFVPQEHPNIAGSGSSTLTTKSHNEKIVLRVWVTGGSALATETRTGAIDAESTLTISGGSEVTVFSHSSFIGYGYCGAYAVPIGLDGAPPVAFTPQWWDTVSLTQTVGTEHQRTVQSNKHYGSAVFIMPSPSDSECVYLGSLQIETSQDSISEYTRDVAIGSHYIGHSEALPQNPIRILDWTFDMYNSVSFGQKNSSPVYAPDAYEAKYKKNVRVVCATQHHEVDADAIDIVITDGVGDTTTEWDYVFHPDDAFARSYTVIESFGGASHVTSKYSPFQMKLLDGAVEDANLFIGYA